MSEFAVQCKVVSEVYPHPNADKLDIIHLEGLTFDLIGAKGLYAVGDRVVFFPEDSVLPEAFVLEHKLEYLKKRHGKYVVVAKNIRKVISQGLIMKIIPVRLTDLQPDMDLTDYFGVTKYEEPVQEAVRGNGVHMPGWVKEYDIRSVQRHTDLYNQMLQTSVLYVTEKIEGQLIAVAFDSVEGLSVCSRHMKLTEESYYWQVAKRIGLIDTVLTLSSLCKRIIVRGELVGPGIQNNIYSLEEKSIYVFDIEIDGQYLSPSMMFETCRQFNIQTVPLLSINGACATAEEMIKKSHGKSALNPTVMREGVVIKPQFEQEDEYGERVMLKVRDPAYVAGFYAGDVKWR